MTQREETTEQKDCDYAGIYVTTWHKSVVNSSLKKIELIFRRKTLTRRKLRPHFLDVVRIPVGNRESLRVSAFPITLANSKFGAVAADTSTSIVVRARPAEKPITPLSVYTGSRLYARPRNVFPLRPRMQRETRSYPRRSGRPAFGEKLLKKPRVAAKGNGKSSRKIQAKEYLDEEIGGVDIVDAISRMIGYAGRRRVGREAGSYLWSAGRAARMGAGGGIVVVIVDSSSGMDGWCGCLRVAGACSTAVLVPLSLGYITKVRSCARASEGNWVNGRTTRFCAACTTAPPEPPERTSSNSIMTLVGMLKFNRVSILSPVCRRKYWRYLDTLDGLFPKVTHPEYRRCMEKTSLRRDKKKKLNRINKINLYAS
ncbi:hypothetical protein ALC57_06967 [Trachymyrmex cornetzi]|uniref:Uncharacterized protein n=1 Tax=Trachymyrmex cornetzi TaxID=471704 RepID=A0A195E629_9HYME|nr:hypothetical protein ALC57_06967 [Trachymyrmex cornetzi]